MRVVAVCLVLFSITAAFPLCKPIQSGYFQFYCEGVFILLLFALESACFSVSKGVWEAYSLKNSTLRFELLSNENSVVLSAPGKIEFRVADDIAKLTLVAYGQGDLIVKLLSKEDDLINKSIS